MSLTEQEIHALIEGEVAKRTAALPARPPRRAEIFNYITGEPPPTPDGMVWPADVAGWCSAELPEAKRYVQNRSEVKPEEVKAPKVGLADLKAKWQKANPHDPLPRENKAFFEEWHAAYLKAAAS